MRCCPLQARELYRLLVEDSRAIRQAAAELVAGMLEPQGKRFIAQVSPQSRQPAAAYDRSCRVLL